MSALLAEVAEQLGADLSAPVPAGDALPSPVAVNDLALGSVAVAARAAANLAQARGGPRPGVVIDAGRVSAAFRSERVFAIDGVPGEPFAELSRFWATADGWVRTHANYPHHRARLLAALGLPATATADDVASRLRQAQALDVEDAVVAAGGVCAAVRTPEQWRGHPHYDSLIDQPLLSIEEIGAAAPRDLAAPPVDPLRPAAGLRVLDLTRVIAGPVATANLALLGADVLRLDSPRLPEIAGQYLVTGMGKRSALLDLATDGAQLRQLVRKADVVVTGYRPGALDRFGLAPRQLAEARPGLVVATVNAWGEHGPWGGRRGFDSIVQAATGLAVLHSADGRTPGALPAQALDYATGYLICAGVLTAVRRQLTEGRTWQVRVSLARLASWLLDHPDETERALPDVSALLRERDSPAGRVRYAPPALLLDGGPDDWPTVGEPWGSARPAWW